MKVYSFLGLILGLIILNLTPARAENGLPGASFTLQHGYVADVNSEVSVAPFEMLMIDKPEVLDGPSMHARVFNSELTNEFLFQYQQKFGRTEFEENYFLVNRQGYTLSPGGMTRTEEDSERRAFAEYVMRRLIEFHTENIMKTDPKFKKVYEVKQAVSNVRVEVTPRTRVEMLYSFVGNFSRINFLNPSANFIILINMDPSALTPTDPREVDARLVKPLSRTLHLEAGSLLISGTSRLALVKRVTPNVQVTLSQTVPLINNYREIDQSRESISLIALGANF